MDGALSTDKNTRSRRNHVQMFRNRNRYIPSRRSQDSAAGSNFLFRSSFDACYGRGAQRSLFGFPHFRSLRHLAKTDWYKTKVLADDASP